MSKYLDTISYPRDLKKLLPEELAELSSEIRRFIIDSVSTTGGHLGSSLGAVEIAVALHYVFSMPYDKIIWDIGHQAYAHKILTGRKNAFDTLRQKGGLSGFSLPTESEYDLFIGGHSSTAISSAFGLKKALNLQNKFAEVIAVIGDSAIAAGMALEAINHLGSDGSRLIIILNDNNMSISKTQGALSGYLAKIKTSPHFSYMKSLFKDGLKDKLPSKVNFIMDKVDSLTRFTTEANVFEALGFSYIGVLDGHDVMNLVDVMENLKNFESSKPIILHLLTKKGKGYEEAENSPDCLHGVEGKAAVKVHANLSNTKVFSNSLIRLAKEDNKVVAITAAMPTGTGLDIFEKALPERFFDVGIAEQHAVTFAAGLAKGGLKPFVCIYSTFMQRAYDQVIHDVAISSLPVRFVMDRAGFVGADGATHAGMFDYSMFLCIPNIVFMAPSCKEDIAMMIDLMGSIDDKPSFIRIAKARHADFSVNYSSISLGKGIVIKQGKDVAVLSIGDILHNVLVARDLLLSKDFIEMTVADAKFAKPIDTDLIKHLTSLHKVLIVVEEGYSSAFAGAVYKILMECNILDKIKFIPICARDIFVEHATIEEQKEISGLDSLSIYNVIKANI